VASAAGRRQAGVTPCRRAPTTAPPDCIFCAIVNGRAPASVVHRDEIACAFMDIRPVTPRHRLVIPIGHAQSLADLPPATGGHLFQVGQRLAAALRRSGLRCEGVNLFMADGEAAGQEVFHVHLHVVPRFASDGFGLRFGPNVSNLPTRSTLDEIAEACSGCSAVRARQRDR
jgi:diadenosine tetraphosphate (Ap4A) HIT family hydrolase